MHRKRLFALLVLVPFTALTAYALLRHGYIGIVTFHATAPAGWQVFADLVIALVIVCGGMLVDARRRGRNPWPYLALTLVGGSFGPLLYLLLSPAPADDSVPARA